MADQEDFIDYDDQEEVQETKGSGADAKDTKK